MNNNPLTVPVSISFFTTHMIKTLILHLANRPLTLCWLIPLLLYMINLLTPLKNKFQMIPKMRKTIAKVAVDDDAQPFEKKMKKSQCHFTRNPRIYRNNTNK